MNDRDPFVDPGPIPGRPMVRRFVAMLVVGVATAQILGYTLKVRSLLEVNDISRWCTVWSLVERGTYEIDTCPWQHRTQDKVKRPNKLKPPTAESSALKKLEYQIAPIFWKDGPAETRTFSSKPPLLPTMIAGVIYPFRQLTHIPLHQVATEPRHPRNIEERIIVWPGVPVTIRRTQPPGKPVEWPAYDFYFKPVLVLFNVLPYGLMLLLYARFLDRHAPNDWAWFFCLFAGAWGTYLFAFTQTLNNHTVAAWSAFFAAYAVVRIVSDGERRLRYFAFAGFFAAFCAANEIPSALLGALVFLALLVRFPKQTLLGFVPAAAIPLVAFFATEMLAFGQLTPVYEEFGTKSYKYELSYWATPLEFDYYNDVPEPKGVYLLHMTVGHHGIWSLSPIFLLAVWGLLVNLVDRSRRMRATAWLTLFLTVGMLAFYAWNPKARNYGGSTQGLRWLFWVIPFWLLMLPTGTSSGQRWAWCRWLQMGLLAVSVFSVGYALQMPWSHPWIVDIMERLGWYDLRH
jgi:hypothetical protein